MSFANDGRKRDRRVQASKARHQPNHGQPGYRGGSAYHPNRLGTVLNLGAMIEHQKSMEKTMVRTTLSFVIAGMLAAANVAAQQQPRDDQQTVETIRRTLVRLPYYGVFDFLAFQYDKGTVTLSGYAYRTGLKRDAVGAVKR